MFRKLLDVHRRVFSGLPAVLFSIICSIFVFMVWCFWVMGLRPPPVLRIRFWFCCVLFWFCCFSSFLPLIMVVFDMPVSSWMARSPLVSYAFDFGC